MDAGRRHDTPGSETKDLMTHSTASSMSVTFTSALFVPQTPQRWWGGIQVDAANRVSLCHSWGISRLGNPDLYRGPQAKLPNPLLHWETLSLPSKDGSYTNIFKKIVHKKWTVSILLIRHSEADTCGEYYPQEHLRPARNCPKRMISLIIIATPVGTTLPILQIKKQMCASTSSSPTQN